ncbi:hypothetical protein FXN61_41245 [Lentzea sp. PSKA42]|uniref:Uncharacterized protein n=1 Tax=Lentzea indica TaxID=2604800 RepID=A0ABX1FVE0_9PSEU|nr:hypothetical protein [Lentzea indica]NKE62809.1 hypothetical protein [Lentzea indica]
MELRFPRVFDDLSHLQAISAYGLLASVGKRPDGRAVPNIAYLQGLLHGVILLNDDDELLI